MAGPNHTICRIINTAYNSNSGLKATPGFALGTGQNYSDFQNPGDGGTGVNQSWFNLFFGNVKDGCMSMGICDRTYNQIAESLSPGLNFSDFSSDRFDVGALINHQAQDSFVGVMQTLLPTCYDAGLFTGTSEIVGIDEGPTGYPGQGVAIIAGSEALSKQSSFVVDTTGGGTRSITGVGFQPDLVVALGCLGGRGVGSGAVRSMYGACDADMNQWAFGNSSIHEIEDDGGIQLTRWRNDKFVTYPSPYQALAAVPPVDLSMVSMDSDGFTFSIDEVGESVEYTIYYVAIKVTSGAGIKVGIGVQGDTSLTCDFQPHAILFGSAMLASNTTGYGSTGAMGMAGLDASGVLDQWANCISISYGYMNPDAAQVFYQQGQDTVGGPWPDPGARMLVDSLDSGGATLSWPFDDSLGIEFGWIAFNVDNIPLIPPVVETDPATYNGAYSETFNATITPNSVYPLDYWFQYGTTTSYGSTTGTSTTDSGDIAASYSTIVTGLLQDTLYHFRVVVHDPVTGCVTYGDDQTFSITNKIIFRNRVPLDFVSSPTPRIGFANFKDGYTHNVEVDYTDGVLSISIDDYVFITHTIDIATFLSLTDAWFGFTAATGGASQEVDILSFICDYSTGSFDYPDLSSITGLNLETDASHSGSKVILTPNASGKVGALWHAVPVPVADNFSVRFTFAIPATAGGGGFAPGDGFAFIIQGVGNTMIGAGGGDQGFGNVTGGVIAVNFDTYTFSHGWNLSDNDLGLYANYPNAINDPDFPTNQLAIVAVPKSGTGGGVSKIVFNNEIKIGN